MTGRMAGPAHDRSEDGMVTAFVVIFVFALLLLAGLVIDGGLTLAARVQAIDEAQAAARAGAQAINLPLFRSTGRVVLDPARAEQAASRRRLVNHVRDIPKGHFGKQRLAEQVHGCRHAARFDAHRPHSPLAQGINRT